MCVDVGTCEHLGDVDMSVPENIFRKQPTSY